MEDKEVGELWRKYQPWSGVLQDFLGAVELQAAKDICALIRKLVEERAELLLRDEYRDRWQEVKDRVWKEYLGYACQGFGIDALD